MWKYIKKAGGKFAKKLCWEERAAADQTRFLSSFIFLPFFILLNSLLYISLYPHRFCIHTAFFLLGVSLTQSSAIAKPYLLLLPEFCFVSGEIRSSPPTLLLLHLRSLINLHRPCSICFDADDSVIANRTVSILWFSSIDFGVTIVIRSIERYLDSLCYLLLDRWSRREMVVPIEQIEKPLIYSFWSFLGFDVTLKGLI